MSDVMIGSEIRRGAVTADGKGEVVLGLGFMLMGENTHQVTWAMKDRLNEIKPTLPANTYKMATYATGNLIWFPVERMGVGIEYLYGTRQDQDGQRGIAHRIQFAMQYRF